MNRSSTVVLVLSGALLSGCGRAAPADVGLIDPADTNTYTNNTYLPSQGYYHAAHHAWYPMPYGHFVPGRGYYYYGGAFQETPQSHTAVVASSPAQSPKAQSAPSRSAASGSSAAESATPSRGGFGSSAHSTTSS